MKVPINTVALLYYLLTSATDFLSLLDFLITEPAFRVRKKY